MDLLEFKRELYDSLCTLHPHYKSAKHVTVRCPFCGDSRKHSTSAHFGVLIDFKNEEEPIFYNCLLCNEGGVMTSEVLHTLDIHNIQLTSSIRTFNKSVMKGIKKMGFRDNNLTLKVPFPEDNELNRLKKHYIEERLGRDFTYEELVRIKTVFSIAQFMEVNEIDQITCQPDKAVELNNKYVGWLTIRNEKISFRQVLDSRFKRYEKYDVYRGMDNTQKFYALPNNIDLTTTEPITLVLSEGAFDVLGAYYHIFNENNHNTIYAAACGSGFVSVIKYFIRKGLIDNFHIIILSDNEPHRTISYYRKMFQDILEWVEDIEIYYNEYVHEGKVEKDFGVPKHRIKVKKQML